MERFHFLLIVIDMNTKLMSLLTGIKKNWNFISILCGLLRKGELRTFQNHVAFSFITMSQWDKGGGKEIIEA